MIITIIGTGFVGVVTSAVFASIGHQVVGVDIDEVKINTLKKGVIPFFEPGLEELVTEGIKSQNLYFTTSLETAIPESDVVIIAVGTPNGPDGSLNTSAIEAAWNSIIPLAKEKAVIAIKSTITPEIFHKFSEELTKDNPKGIMLASLPEFLREGAAVNDTLHPDRIVIGADDPEAIKLLTRLHQPLSDNIIVVSPESAQMSKVAANNYLALRIAFINQIAEICEKSNAHINEVIRVIGEDKRIGSHYWYPGLGYGGSCFPKDVKGLQTYARNLHADHQLLTAMDEFNEQRIEKKMHEYEKLVDGFSDKTVAVLGLSFKPNTTDMRMAPSLGVIPYLKDRKAIIKAYDPRANLEAKRIFPKLFIGNDLQETLQGADVVMLLVEWPEFITLDFQSVSHLLHEHAWIIDTRNVYNKNDIEQLGFHYQGIGNP